MGTPFPWLPMLAMATGLVSHSYTVTSLFPYVGYMVEHLGVAGDKDQAGYFAGYLSAALMIGRLSSSYLWGRFSDRYGRLPVLYIGLFSMASLSVAFGFSTSFYWAMTCRFFLGASNGLVANSNTMISEICGREHEVLGMTLGSGCWFIGLVIGPGFGGMLAEPATRYPRLFSDSGLFGRFPYLLPNLVGASLALAGLLLAFFFLEETRHWQDRSIERTGFKPLPTAEADRRQRPPLTAEDDRTAVEMAPLVESKVGNDEPNGSDDPNSSGSYGFEGTAIISSPKRMLESGRGLPPPTAASTGPHVLTGSATRRDSGHSGSSISGNSCMEGRGGGWNAFVRRECLVPVELVSEPRVRAVLFVYVVLAFASLGGQEAYPLWAISTVENGGLDWTTKQIGQCLSLCGGGMLVYQLFFFPRLIKRVGTKRAQRAVAIVAVSNYLAFPLLSRLHDSGPLLVASSLVLLFLENSASSTMFINIALVTNNAVGPSRRGTLNGLSMMLGSLAKAAGPASTSVVFAWSISRQPRRPFPLDFHLVFYVLAFAMGVVAVASWNTIVQDEDKGEGLANPSLSPEQESMAIMKEDKAAGEIPPQRDVI
ncbi:unnamed protein product [Ectocarpus sp. 12 AP-2014]